MAVLALAPVLLLESRDPGRVRAFDLRGALIVTAALSVLVYAITLAPYLIVLALALLAAFVLVERRASADQPSGSGPELIAPATVVTYQST